MKKRLFCFCLISIFALGIGVQAYASEDMLSGKQDLVVLGSVKDIVNNRVVVTVDHVLGQDDFDLPGKDIDISKFAYTYCEKHSGPDFRSPKISDNVVISLNRQDEGYQLANCAYKVDSNEYASCKIVVLDTVYEEDCTKELLKATCYIRSNGMVNEFEFDSQGRIYAVYPQSVEQCVTVVNESGEDIAPVDEPDTLPSTTMPQDTLESHKPPLPVSKTAVALILLIGALAGFAVFYVLGAGKRYKALKKTENK